MQSLSLRSIVGADGILRLQLPVGLANVELDILVVMQPLTATNRESSNWLPGFFEQTFGCLQDEPIDRPAQGEFEQRYNT